MTRIVMLRTKSVTMDGFNVEPFHKNTCYDIGDSTACHLVAEGHARLAEADYVDVKWKSGHITTQPMSDTLQHLIDRGTAIIMQACLVVTLIVFVTLVGANLWGDSVHARASDLIAHGL